MSKFNFNIDTIDDNNSISISKSSIISKSQKQMMEEYKCIDMGLPSRLLWATHNLGVNPNNLNEPGDWYGDYYEWGEIEIKDDFSEGFNAYKFYNNGLIKYVFGSKKDKSSKNKFFDNISKLLPEDDAAYINLGSNWRIPTQANYDELIHFSSVKIVHNYNDIYNLNGVLLTSLRNDNSIFLPFAGIAGTKKNEYMKNEIHNKGAFWLSNLHKDQTSIYGKTVSYYETNNKLSMYEDAHLRCCGISIRPVYNYKN